MPRISKDKVIELKIILPEKVPALAGKYTIKVDERFSDWLEALWDSRFSLLEGNIADKRQLLFDTLLDFELGELITYCADPQMIHDLQCKLKGVDRISTPKESK